MVLNPYFHPKIDFRTKNCNIFFTKFFSNVMRGENFRIGYDNKAWRCEIRNEFLTDLGPNVSFHIVDGQEAILTRSRWGDLVRNSKWLICCCSMLKCFSFFQRIKSQFVFVVSNVLISFEASETTVCNAKIQKWYILI